MLAIAQLLQYNIIMLEFNYTPGTTAYTLAVAKAMVVANNASGSIYKAIGSGTDSTTLAALHFLLFAYLRGLHVYRFYRNIIHEN